MRTLLVALLGTTLVTLAAPAQAHVVEVTTVVSLTDVEDQDGLTTALHNAVNEAIQGAVAFKPTLVALTRANVIGERLYVRLLVADAEGEDMLRDLVAGEPTAGDDDDAASPRRAKAGETI